MQGINKDAKAQEILETTIKQLELLIQTSENQQPTTADLIYGCLCSINGLAYTNDNNLGIALCLLSDLLGNILEGKSSNCDEITLN